MDKFLISLIISLLFFVVKIIERNSSSEPSPVKYLVRDTIIVYLCSACTLFMVDKFSNYKTNIDKTDPVVYTNNPDF
jgi:hypothetical protein